MSAGFGERLAGFGYAAGWHTARVLPEPTAYALFRAGADVASRRQGPGVRQLRANLARVVPKAGEDELDELVRSALHSYARYWCETFRLPTMQPRAVYDAVDAAATGQENLQAALAKGDGAILALTHSGNWDAAGVWLAQHLGQFTTVAERVRPESLYRRFAAYRRSLGFELLPLHGGERPAGEVLAERLRQNKVICLLADRNLANSGMPVTFFGERARMPPGPAFLAATTGAALLPVGAWYTGRSWGFRVHPPVTVRGRREVRAATQTLADVFASDIAAHPADWHMMQPFWSADRRMAAAGHDPTAPDPDGEKPARGSTDESAER